MNKETLMNASHVKLVSILIVLAYFFLMFGNGIVSLTHPDEVFYTQSAKEMIAHNSWLTPMIFDHPQFEKPIFFFWLLGLAVKIFGISPFVARFWPAFFGIIGTGVTYWVAWILFHNKRIAFLSGIILSSSFIYFALARAVLTDMVFSIIVVISIGFFCQAYYHRSYKSVGIILCFGFTGLAVLTKGLLGLCFPAFTVLSFLLYKNDLGFFKTKATVWGIFLFLVIAVPWHVIMHQWYGQQFIDEYWTNVHVRRLFEAEHPRNNFFFFYFILMFAGIMPWGLFWIPMIYLTAKHIRQLKAHKDRLVLLFLWILSVFVFIQPAVSKLASYIFPVYPAIAILIARYIIYALDRHTERFHSISLRSIGFAMSALMLAGCTAALFFSHQYADYMISMTPGYVLALLTFVCAVALFVFSLKKKYVRLIIANLCITITVLTTLFLIRPTLEPWVSCIDICRVFNKIDQSDSVVLTSKFYARGIRFYTGRDIAVINIKGKQFFSPHPIPFLDTHEKVRELLAKQPVTYAIVRRVDIGNLQWSTKNRFKMTQLDDIGGKYILKIEHLAKKE